jgi:hypothetical protein
MSDKPISDLRRRMIADMTIRTFSDKTQRDHIRHIEAFASFLGRSPDTATGDDIRRNRHCPKCQGAAARKWMAAREAELLPVSYFHVVFTLPSAIGDIAYQNKAVIYDDAVVGCGISGSCALFRRIAMILASSCPFGSQPNRVHMAMARVLASSFLSRPEPSTKAR